MVYKKIRMDNIGHIMLQYTTPLEFMQKVKLEEENHRIEYVSQILKDMGIKKILRVEG